MISRIAPVTVVDELGSECRPRALLTCAFTCGTRRPPKITLPDVSNHRRVRRSDYNLDLASLAEQTSCRSRAAWHIGSSEPAQGDLIAGADSENLGRFARGFCETWDLSKWCGERWNLASLIKQNARLEGCGRGEVMPTNILCGERAAQHRPIRHFPSFLFACVRL